MILITKKKSYNWGYFVSENNTFKHKINKEIQLLLPTSGTTGSLKFVMLTKKYTEEYHTDIINYLKLIKKVPH